MRIIINYMLEKIKALHEDEFNGAEVSKAELLDKLNRVSQDLSEEQQGEFISHFSTLRRVNSSSSTLHNMYLAANLVLNVRGKL